MKTFIVALCFLETLSTEVTQSNVSAGKGYTEISGCEDWPSVKNIKAASCCIGLPLLFNKGVIQNCTSVCTNSSFDMRICVTDCTLKHYHITDNDSGKFNKTKAIAFIKTFISKMAYQEKWV